jgi:type I restriction enzyme M protein
MLIDARKQFEKEPKAFGNKRNRITEAHRQWIETRYRDGWKPGYSDPQVKIFRNDAEVKDFAYHKVSVVFWQTDEHDQPAIITEPYDKAFTAANVAKEQEFYDSELKFSVRLTDPAGGRTATVEFALAPDDSFPKVFGKAAREAFAPELEARTKKLTDADDKKKVVKRCLDELRAEAEWTHRHYVKDDEYIPFGEDIPAFLKREIGKPIIRWKDSEQLGYEILPNKYFFRYQPPTPAKELLAEFWRLEKEAEGMLEGLAK